MTELDGARFPLKVGERSWTAEVIEREAVTSRHTGRQLENVSIAFRSMPGDDDMLSDLASQARRGAALADGRRWRLASSSYSTWAPSDRRNHTWHLQEVEVLAPESVTIDGLALRPTRYHEEFRGGRLRVDLRVTVGNTDLSRLRDLWSAMTPVTVARVGISTELRRMKLEWREWSEMEDGAKVQLTLEDDDPAAPGPITPLIWNMRTALAYARAHQDALMELLVRKGVLEPDEVRALADSAAIDQLRRVLRLMLVDDLDEWDWDHEEAA